MPANTQKTRKTAKNAPKQRQLTGITAPRLWTPPLRPLNRRTSRGYSVCDFADFIGEPCLPWQRWLNIHAMEILPDDSYRFRIVLVLVARQNGKSTDKRTVSLWRLYIDGARLVLGTAQDVGLAREQWNYCLDTIYAVPDLAGELDGNPRRVNGDEWFRIKPEDDDGAEKEGFGVKGTGRYKIAASNRKAGRGLSVDELNIDELRVQQDWAAWSSLSKTTMARPNSQIWAMSNAGDEESVVLNQLRERALSGADPSIGLFEWSAPDGCDLDDEQAWRQANPGLGYIISEQAIRLALATDPPEVFRTEVLCQKVDHLDAAIDLAAWRDCADPTGTLDSVRDRIACCFDMAPDGQHATLAAAALLPDGRVRVEIATAWNTSDQARAEVQDWLTRIGPKVIGWYPSGPGGAFAPLLRPIAKPNSRQPETIELTGGKVAEICQGLADLTRARRILHPAQDLLTAHITGASKLPSGDGWRFTRKGTGHVDAAYAAAGAVYLAQTLPPVHRARLRWIS